MSELTAADVIAEACETITDECVNRYPEQAEVILEALNYEGFAVVRLPGPDYHDAATGEPVWGLGACRMPRGPEQMRAQAVAWLAAAAWAEEADQ